MENEPAAEAPRSAVRPWLRVVRPLLVVVAMGFMGLVALRLGREWEASRVELAWGWVATAAAILVAVAFTQAFGWIALLAQMSGRRVAIGPAFANYFESQLARYLPGKAGLPLVRIAGAARLGVPAAVVGVGVFVELLGWCAVGATLGVGAVALAPRGTTGLADVMGSWTWPLFAAGAVGVVLLATVDRRVYGAMLNRHLGSSGAGPLIPAALIGWHALHWAGWAAHGICMALAVGAPWDTALAAAGYFVLAPLAGTLALATPAGVGVREALIALGLASAVGAPTAVAVAVVSRAASVAVEVLVWAAWLPLRGRGDSAVDARAR